MRDDAAADDLIEEIQQSKFKGEKYQGDKLGDYERDFMNALEDRREARVNQLREQSEFEKTIKGFEELDQQAISIETTLTDLDKRNLRFRHLLHDIYRSPPNIVPASESNFDAFETDVYNLTSHHIHRTLQGLRSRHHSSRSSFLWRQKRANLLTD